MGSHDADGNRIAEYLYDDLTQSSTLLREYVWLYGQVVAVIEGGVVSYVRSDHIGRPVIATNVSGVKVWEASYLPFGGVHTSTGSNTDLRFPGQWFQSEAGLHQNWMRDYDPTLGRYIEADPLGLVDGASVYGYARQNPGRFVDPFGLYVVVCKATGGQRGFGEVGYETGSFAGGSRKRCRYTCTRQDTNVTKEFESCGMDMNTGDQCLGVPYYSQSIMDPPYSTTRKTGEPPKEFTHDTDRSLFDKLFDSRSIKDFDADVRIHFGEN